ncbi:hypothetical protein TS85_22505 [Sphingomonas hengshuiensis]|uniref:Uncharacterized protein n=1 Tax=Sphingomonas hengshuiensis TaxID=1609977 RepID=A0A7U5BE92_9SPHN|nr:hypothetical protein TS85_00310 [Sphingomonas hengshuiensis]AJP73980.1 hypothetical protein TS85_22505 [Sphingomonas hengshuiensis]
MIAGLREVGDGIGGGASIGFAAAKMRALASIYECGTRSEAARVGGVGFRRVAIGYCGSTPPGLTG